MATDILSLGLGSATIPLYLSGALVLDYMPQSAALGTVGQGQEIYEVERQPVTETVRLWLYGESPAAVQSLIGSIERWAEGVHRRQRTRTGERGYLLQQVRSDTEMWRSEVLAARLQPADENLRRWGSGVEVLLFVTRRPFWETVAERELPLDNTSAGGPATGGVTIYNHDDATTGHDNWVDVAAVDVAGNLPAPLRLRMTNNSGANIGYRNFWQANNSHYSPATFVHVIEGESMVGVTQVADGGSSGGYYGRASWTTLIQHVVDLYKWQLPSSLLTAAAGGFFRVLVRFANTPPSGMEFQLHIKTVPSPIFSLWDGPKFTASGALLQDCGIVQLPPGATGGSYYDLNLVLSGEYTGTSQLDIDFVQLTPADSTRWFKQIGYQIPPNDAIENNGPEDRVYEIDAATGQQSYLYEAYSAALHVWPSRDQRLFFLFDEASTMNISRSSSIRAWYRPRRSTL